MDKKEYKKLTNKIIPKENKLKDYLISFLVGGLMGFIGQLIVSILEISFHIKHNDATSIMIVLLIFIALLGEAASSKSNSIVPLLIV